MQNHWFSIGFTHIADFGVFEMYKNSQRHRDYKHIPKKLRKCEKPNVNGAGDVQYVLLESLTARPFYSMLWSRANIEFGRTKKRALRGRYMDEKQNPKTNMLKPLGTYDKNNAERSKNIRRVTQIK